MNEKIIKEIVDDYSLRELQIYSSFILSNIDATNNFIKQFKADHDSHQFYKNVIIWYVKNYNIFPENILTFDFALNEGGLGDRFILASNLLYTFDAFGHILHPQINLYTVRKRSYQPDKLLKADNFYDIIDFFHFKHPKQKITTQKINNYKAIEECNEITNIFSKNNCINIQSFYQETHDKFWKSGAYWPINFKPKPKTVITFMFYMIGECVGDENKTITFKMLKEFEKCKNKFSNLNFVRLEDINFAKNVELLSKSHLLIASEGMWTHLSRAMKIDTIAFTRLEEFKIVFNNQGHFCSENFDECLNELKTKCTNLLK